MKRTLFALLLPLLASIAHAETKDLLAGDDILSAFQSTKLWRGVAEVAAVDGKTELTLAGEGKILVNGATKEEKAPYLITAEDFGDVRVELEFMVPKGSNAGVYLMGRYEVQILDSFGRERFVSGDLGGIYQQWDPSRGKGKEGFGGIKPRVNAAKAPGEWQTMEIIFRAPRFNEDGRKTRSAIFEKVIINGELVQENVTTTGPTRAHPLKGETTTGPIAIQGDHGPIAIRKYTVTTLPDPEPARLAELDAYWDKVSRAVAEGDWDTYKATAHPDAILVSGVAKQTYPLTHAFARWVHEFEDTKAGKMKASVDFRFNVRYGDATTAYEAGIFRYEQIHEGVEPKPEFIEFEALLRKEDGQWLIVMEYQKSVLSEADWDKVAR